MNSAAAETPGLSLRRLGGATALMMTAVLASRLIGYLREAYIAFAFGAGSATDAFVTAFTIPDWLNYLVAGGSLSITFITIFSPYLAQRREEEGYQVFSIIATFMALLLAIGILLAEWFAPQLLHLYVPQFNAREMAECLWMTRLLLPAQLFFCVGGLIAAVLYARGSFLLPALAPLVYNTSIIIGGIVLGRWMGISSLAVGALAGAILGPFLLPLAGAWRTGLRYRFSLAFGHPEFRHWLRLTLPLMVGVSLVTADDWIMRPLAAAQAVGAISHLNYAKRLIGVPIAVLGQAVGQASMPFFAWLATQNRWDTFRETLDRSVLRTVAGALLVASWLSAISYPLVKFVYQRGHFTAADSRLTATYFSLFLLALAFWSAQALYARAFYAAGDTFTPMAATSMITVASIPLYIWLSHRMGIVGLAVASDLGIAAQAIALALLLQRRGRLGFARSRWRLLPGLIIVAVTAGAVGFGLDQRLAPHMHRLWQTLALGAVVSALWLTVTMVLARLLGLRRIIAESLRLMERVAGRIGIMTPRGEGGG